MNIISNSKTSSNTVGLRK